MRKYIVTGVTANKRGHTHVVFVCGDGMEELEGLRGDRRGRGHKSTTA